MAGKLITLITSPDPALRNLAIDPICAKATISELLEECAELESFRRHSENLYERVRALLFLYAIHRFHLPTKSGFNPKGLVPFAGYKELLNRRFHEAITSFLTSQELTGPNEAISSALATSYHGLAFQTLADQVRKSVRSVRGNHWMFRVGHPSDHPLHILPSLLCRSSPTGPFPILRELTPVRMDLTHSAWSDIFFLGMDYPEGARVINISIDLGVNGRDDCPKPPVEAYLRVIDEPVLRIVSVDLGASADITELADVFDFAKDHLGLLKAAIIASGIIPPGMEGSGHSLVELLERIVGPGLGLEIVSSVNNIPKGSRLAVSTHLLGSLISVCMRATGQSQSLTGSLKEVDRRLVAARAILGEWIGGSGGGWQDSGGVWPGIKLIEGAATREGDPEVGISRGRLLPTHKILDLEEVPSSFRQSLQDSLVLVHGGMAQNVGPILEMVTEKYLLRSSSEWKGRQEALRLLDQMLAALKRSDVQTIGQLTHENFFGPLQTIIPWVSNLYTETLINKVRAEFGEKFWGFWMLGGMAGGGMGFLFSPCSRAQGQKRLHAIMLETKGELESSLPFAMEPVVYNFAINSTGTTATILEGQSALLPSGYYALTLPSLLRMDSRELSPLRRAELDRFGASCRVRSDLSGMVQILFDRLFPQIKSEESNASTLATLLNQNGFDLSLHEVIRADLKQGRIGLAQNRLPANTTIRDVESGDITDTTIVQSNEYTEIGLAALKRGEAAVVTLAAGVGSRWTQGAGVVKALHPFAKLSGKHRTFIEAHLAKSRRLSRTVGSPIPHIFTTSYLTHDAIEAFLKREQNYNYEGPVILSAGRSIGLRLVPMVRDLRFAWEELFQQKLDEQKEKVRQSIHNAWIHWAQQCGEGSDYTANLPNQCIHPVGHWFEISNLLLNGVLDQLLTSQPQLKYLLLHNIDTLGADLDPALLGTHIKSGATLNYEVITRRVDDRGGGLARVDGKVRIVEGLAMPREEAEFSLSYFNSMTTWISIDGLLKAFQLVRSDLKCLDKVTLAIRDLSVRMPTYVTLKEVKKRWGQGQEDVFPVMQFEKLWGDMSALPDVDTGFMHVTRARGQQLKDQAQLDGWLRDGSAEYINSIAEWK